VIRDIWMMEAIIVRDFWSFVTFELEELKGRLAMIKKI
jgi:hypothetical protein